MQGAHINLTVFDRDLNEYQNDLLNEVQVNLTVHNIQLGVETLPKTYTGPMGYSNITLSFYVTCAENWYGPYCNIFSQDFACDLPVPCHDNCVGVVCGENRHCVDGVDVYVCTCDSGFAGRKCEINIDDCEGVNCSGNRGRCIDGINSFQCECDSGYSGVLCEIANEGLPRCGIANSSQGSKQLIFLLWTANLSQKFIFRYQYSVYSSTWGDWMGLDNFSSTDNSSSSHLYWAKKER